MSEDSRTAPVPRPAPPLSPVGTGAARVVLIGPPAAGKTTVGRLLAERLDVSMRDTDAMLVAAHGPISDIFADRGEPGFRQLERASVDEALRELLRRPGVVSLGGGAVLNPETRHQLKHPGFAVVLISIDEKTVAGRLGHANRPLLAAGGQTPLQRWRELVAERTPLYEEVADMVVHASSSPPTTVVNKIVEALGLHRAAGEEPAHHQHHHGNGELRAQS